MAAEEPAFVVTTSQTTDWAQSLAEKDILNFALGQPGPRLLSLPHFTQAFEAAFRPTDGSTTGLQVHPTMLAYSNALGHRDFRQALAAWLSQRYEFPIEEQDLLMTNGNTHALDFVCRHIVHQYIKRVSAARAAAAAGGGGAADAAPASIPRRAYFAMDDPTYFLAGGCVKRYVDFVNFGQAAGDIPALTLRMCSTSPDTGFDVEALATWLEEIYAQGDVLLGIYVIPIFHNPTGSSVTPASALRLVELAHKYDFYVLSDEPYPFLKFDEAAESVISMAAVEHAFIKGTDRRQKVVAMGSFSKIFAPGLRLGWVQADPELIEKGFKADPILDSGGGVNPVAGVVVKAMLAGSTVEPKAPYSLDNYLEELVPELRSRSGALSDALRARFGEEIKFNQPTGGYFLWIQFLTTVEGFTSAGFKAFAIANKEQYRVSFLPGTSCRAASGEGVDEDLAPSPTDLSMCIRLSFAFYEVAELEEGVRRLRVVYDAYLASLQSS